MNKNFFNIQTTAKHWFTTIILLLSPIFVMGQENGEKAVEELVNHGFENVRWTDTKEERIYTIENNVYKANGVGIAKAIETIQKSGLPTNKRCKVIVTNLDIPEIALTYHPSSCDSISDNGLRNWQTSYEIGNSWKEVKKEKIKNSFDLIDEIAEYSISGTFLHCLFINITRFLFKID